MQYKILNKVTSTNTFLLDKIRANTLKNNFAVVANQQTQGRGRGGKTWMSQEGGGLYLSYAYRFEQSVHDLPCLSLVMGLSTINAIKKKFALDLSIKWPNDIYIHHKKLAGILCESCQNHQGTWVVIGLGLNLTLPTEQKHELNATDLSEHNVYISAEELAPTLLQTWQKTLEEFINSGFTSFIPIWQKYDYLRGKEVDIHDNSKIIQRGKVVGITPQGALLLLTPQGELPIMVGDVSVRAMIAN